MIDRFGPRVGHLNHLAVPGVGIFEVLFVPVTTNHFPGWEIQLYLTSHFCPRVGNLTAILWQMSKSRPMPRLPPRRLDIDRCIDRCISCPGDRLQSIAYNFVLTFPQRNTYLSCPERSNLTFAISGYFSTFFVFWVLVVQFKASPVREQSRSQSPRGFWSAPRRVLVLTKRHVVSGNEIPPLASLWWIFTQLDPARLGMTLIACE